MSDAITLTVGGQRFEGWKDIEVSRDLETISGAFQIGLTERWPGHSDKWDIEAGAPCELAIAGEKVLTGYIDAAEYGLTPDDHSVKIAGRDKTADLIDCSAIHSPGSWKNRKLEQIASDLAAPFGITVKAATATGAAFPRFALQPGESVFEAIDRMAKQRGVLPVATVDGNLELRRPGQVKAGYQLELGRNLESITFKNDVHERFSEYRVKGHASGPDFLKGHKASRPAAAAKDEAIPRYRPLIIVNENTGTVAGMSDRAKWEATVRAGRGQTATALVSGWRSPAGELYNFDRLVHVLAPLVGVDQDLLISGVSWRLSEQGSTTQLTLTRKEAYSLLAIPPKSKKRKGKGVDPLTKS
jgi:prophage tail gpP-like protein